MTEIPEHLLKRSRSAARRSACPCPAKRAARPRRPPADAPARPKPRPRPRPPPARGARRRRRRRRRRPTASGAQDPRPPARAVASAAGRARAAAAAATPRAAACRRGAAATATATLPAPTADRPGRSHAAAAHGRQVGLDPADPRRGPGQGAHLAAPARRRVRGDPDRHRRRSLIFSALVRAPLLGLADFNKTPNPSKAPWYFLGLQELLTMFHPMVAGVTIPGMGLFLLMVAPFVDKNPSNKPEGPEVRDLDLHDLPDVLGGARHHRLVLPGPGLQLRVPLERRHLLRAVGADVWPSRSSSPSVAPGPGRRRGPRHRPRRRSTTGSPEPRDAQARRPRPARPCPGGRARGRGVGRGRPSEAPRPRRRGPPGDRVGRPSARPEPRPRRPPVVYEPVDDEELGVTRRQFFNRSILAASASGSARSAWRRSRSCGRRPAGGFGGKVDRRLATPTPRPPSTNKIPFYNAGAKTYIVAYPKADLPKAKKVPAYAPVIAGMEQGYVALYQKCVHLGCRVPWCQSSQWFECPCHGSKYNRVGEKQGGPAPRGLDRFVARGRRAATSSSTPATSCIGPPDRHRTPPDQSPEGAPCV